MVHSQFGKQEVYPLVGRAVFGLFSTICLLVTVWEPPSDTAIAQTSAGGAVEAVSAAAFLNSMGINVHVAQGYDAGKYVEPLKYTGIRNIRDSGERLPGLLRLHEETGVKVDFLSWCRLNEEIIAAQQLATAGALLAIEGPNEPNNFVINYNGDKGGGKGDWLPVARCQQDLFKTVKADKLLRTYPVFNMSEGGAEPTNVGLQYLTIPAGAHTDMPDGTQYADYANVHNYVSSKKVLYDDNQAWQAADPTLDGDWDGLYVEYGRTWRGKFPGYSEADLRVLPRVTTETGWDTAGNPGGQPVQGKVLVNTYLAQFKRGWRYTFIYELVDAEGSPGDQGLYTALYAPKLAATYIHNLTTILADKDVTAPMGHLNYSIPGAPTAVHDLLLQKDNGNFELVVWGEQVKQSANLVVHFTESHKTIKVYDVTTAVDPAQTYNDAKSVPLVITDHAMIIEVVN
jgi:hypothetical protein